jgi:N-acetylneuraminate epimerase
MCAVTFIPATAASAADVWPDLPVGIKNGIAARVGDIAYVGLGSAGTDLYSLDLTHPDSGWKKRPSFIGPATMGAASATSGGKIFVFSGNGKPAPEAKTSVIFETVYSFDPATDTWSKLDTATPVGLSGAKALGLKDGRIAIVGGYNKRLFDKYVADIAASDREKEPAAYKSLVDSYMAMEPKAYQWNTKVLSYNPAANQWSALGDNPFLPNCDSAVAGKGDDNFVVVSGEIKPGLRTPEVKSLEINQARATWARLADLPIPTADARQEGVAGAFAGQIGETLLVAGGANFVGAQANAAAGKWFAHEGLQKKWRDEIYALREGHWAEIGRLPTGIAYGAAFELPTGLLIVGGEDSSGKARADVFQLSLMEQTVALEE